MNKKNKHKNILQEGVISITSRGTGYVAVGEDKKKGEDPEIDFKHLHTALHGDTVKILLHPKGHGRQTGEVVEVTKRAKMRFAGVLEDEGGVIFLKPDDPKMYTDILIPNNPDSKTKINEKALVEIVSWKDASKAPIGKIISILGKPGDNNTEMESIVLERGFSARLPESLEHEAQRMCTEGIRENDMTGRRDFRKILTFTIDPEDAKDFDDAISFQQISKTEFEVGIHIADVSHYVKEGSELDREARERGTSVYLVDRTVPMLPEALSNDLCSLVPNKDRLTMSAVFVLNHNADVLSEWYGRTVIHSQKRFTYEEAELSIKTKTAPLHEELFILNSLAKKLHKTRFSAGAISLEQTEVKFVLDKNGVPIKVIKKERGDSNKMIEELMLLANRKVAELLSASGKKGGKADKDNIAIFRIHDSPSREKMDDLAFFLRSMGHRVSQKNGLIPSKEINKLLESLSGKGEADTVHRAVIRSMAKAIYSTKNIGHYGLAFSHYTHFTSPIRRYPDIIIHRLLSQKLENKKIGRHELKIFEEMSRTASEQEKRASDAERASIKYKQAEYMGQRLGKVFEGVISNITEWGIYVEERETKCEGLVRIRDLKDDYYIFNEKKLELRGRSKNKKYRLGDKTKIKVKSVDLERKTIDYELV